MLLAALHHLIAFAHHVLPNIVPPYLPNP